MYDDSRGFQPATSAIAVIELTVRPALSPIRPAKAIIVRLQRYTKGSLTTVDDAGSIKTRMNSGSGLCTKLCDPQWSLPTC